MHNREDEQIALDAKCPNTPDMFAVFAEARRLACEGSRTRDFKLGQPCDKCISDDFPKQIDQRNNPED